MAPINGVRNTTLRANAPVFVSGARPVILRPVNQIEGVVEEGKRQYMVDMSETTSQLASGSVAPPLNFQPTEDQRRAVSIIEKIMRHKLDLRKQRSNATRHYRRMEKHYTDCLDVLVSRQFQDAVSKSGDVVKKKLVFLGVVPHMLLVLQVVEEYASAKEKKDREQFGKVHLKGLDQVGKSMDEITLLLKQHQDIKKRLQASSSFYLNPQGFTLRPDILKLEQLVLKEWPLPGSVKTELLPDLDVCVWAVDARRTRDIVKKRTAKEAKRPELKW
ncbi:hypothetical protein DL96DRAFT_224834 [Flagelloscypha sp. PMI_526]|nr:hypothetical protein DL96DRAFT_224834 [Flagelloscypha sp. PMI_526]